MAHKDLHLVLRFDSSNPATFESIKELMKQTCREVYAAALLIHGAQADGSPKPDLTLYSDDFFEGKSDLDIHDSEEAQAADAAVDKSDVVNS